MSLTLPINSEITKSAILLLLLFSIFESFKISSIEQHLLFSEMTFLRHKRGLPIVFL